MAKKTILDARKKSAELAQNRQEKRASIKEKLKALPANTVIDRYILRDGQIVHLRKEEYKKLLEEKAIQIVENKPKVIDAEPVAAENA